MKLSITIPCFNEQDNIKRVVTEVHDHFPHAQIIVVDDASTDSTPQILESIKLKHLTVLTNEKNMGHGYSVIRALRFAKGDYILYIDADRQLSLHNFKIYEGCDFVSGFRVSRQDKLFRKLISFCLKITNLGRHRFYMKDANCPFKIYKRSALWKVLPKVPDTYIIPIACLEVLARRHKLTTLTVPTLHYKYWTERKGTLQTINMKSLKFFKDAFKEITSL